jgi:hypothetical protein
VRTNEPDVGGGCEAIATLEDLGRYLQELRGKWHVTQESLSTKTGAITDRKISRSRISEIENAKRDRVTERELRVYMRGLKCTPRHIDQVVKALTQCTAPPANEFPTSPDATSSVTLDADPAGLGGAEDDLAPWEEESDDDPAAAGHEEEGRDRWPQVNMCLTPLAASLSQLSRHRWQHHRIAFAATTALIVVALAGLGVGLSLRGESGDRPKPPASPTASLLPHSVPLIADDASDLIKDATLPPGVPVRVNQRSAEVWEIWNRFVTRGDAAGRDATQRLIKVGPVTPCGVELAGRRRPGTAPQCRGNAVAGPGSSEVPGPGIVIGPSRTTDAGSDAVRGGLLETWEPDCCMSE